MSKMNEQFFKVLFERNCPVNLDSDGTYMFYISLHCVSVTVYARNEDGSWKVVGFTIDGENDVANV